MLIKDFEKKWMSCFANGINKKAIQKNVNFVGNVFWYDFSLNKNPLVMQGEILDGWLDATIENFDPIHENIKCQKQIVDNLSKNMKNVLITHMVPHIKLNWFSFSF